MGNKLFAAFSKSLTAFFLVMLFNSCKKEIVNKEEEKKAVDEIATSYTGGNGTSCYDIELLLPHSDGTLTGYVENVPITLSSVITQAYDNNGNPIVYAEGDPFWGQMSVTSSSAEVLYSSSSPQDDQFAVRIWQMGISTVNVSAYQTAFSNYVNGQPSPSGNIAGWLFSSSMPQISNYTTTAGSAGYHDIVGRLIRVNPSLVQSGTDANGNPTFVYTTYALAPPCYPRPGIRAGTTSATIIPWNTIGCTSPSSVEFLQNGIVIKTVNFPTTYQTTGASVKIPGGSYNLRFNFPSGYPELSFRIMGAGYYWETGDPATTFSPASAITFSAGTSYTIREAAMYE